MPAAVPARRSRSTTSTPNPRPRRRPRRQSRPPKSPPAASRAIPGPIRPRCTPPPRSSSAAPIATAATPPCAAIRTSASPIHATSPRASGRMCCPAIRKAWNYPSSANPKRSYTLLNKEAPEFIRFVNPGDYRVVRESCGACHMEIIEASERSLMASGAMLWGGAAYNNGILPYKNYIFGEAYTRDGQPAKIVAAGTPPGTVTDAQKRRGALAAMYPLPAWQVDAAGRHLPRVRARRAQRSAPSSPRSACPTLPARSSSSRSPAGLTSSNRIAAPAPACASRSRSSTSTRPGSTIPCSGSWGPTTSPATIADRAAPAATWSTPTIASRATA